MPAETKVLQLIPDIVLTGELPEGVTEEDFEDYREARRRANTFLLSTIQSTTDHLEEELEDEIVEYPHVKSIIFGAYEIETWYSSPFPMEYVILPKMYFCEFCLDFKKSQMTLDRHLAKCRKRWPPGNEIYRKDDVSVWEVDGNLNPHYSETLSRLSMFFLTCKVDWQDVDTFFYLLTKNDRYGCHIVGYFSVEKSNLIKRMNNLTHIMVFPQYQGCGYGRFLIAFSYLLSRVEGIPGTPERPFSEYGERSYRSFWRASVLEYFDKHRGFPVYHISDIVAKTGILQTDLIQTMRKLKFINMKRKWKPNLIEKIDGLELVMDDKKPKEIHFWIDWKKVDAHVFKLTQSTRMNVDPACLSWTPPWRRCNNNKNPKDKKSEIENSPNKINLPVKRSVTPTKFSPPITRNSPKKITHPITRSSPKKIAQPIPTRRSPTKINHTMARNSPSKINQPITRSSPKKRNSMIQNTPNIISKELNGGLQDMKKRRKVRSSPR